MAILLRTEGSTATRGFAQTIRGEIAMGLRVKYFMNFLLFPVAIVTYVLYGLVLTQTSMFVLKLFNLGNLKVHKIAKNI